MIPTALMSIKVSNGAGLDWAVKTYSPGSIGNREDSSRGKHLGVEGHCIDEIDRPS
jgi:hypothetical protein